MSRSSFIRKLSYFDNDQYLFQSFADEATLSEKEVDYLLNYYSIPVSNWSSIKSSYLSPESNPGNVKYRDSIRNFILNLREKIDAKNRGENVEESAPKVNRPADGYSENYVNISDSERKALAKENEAKKINTQQKTPPKATTSVKKQKVTPKVSTQGNTVSVQLGNASTSFDLQKIVASVIDSASKGNLQEAINQLTNQSDTFIKQYFPSASPQAISQVSSSIASQIIASVAPMIMQQNPSAAMQAASQLPQLTSQLPQLANIFNPSAITGMIPGLFSGLSQQQGAYQTPGIASNKLPTDMVNAVLNTINKK